jgi:hypothetical protein
MISQVHLGAKAKSIVPPNNYQLETSNYEFFFLNLAISNELWVQITAFEITLRNFINFSLAQIYQSSYWWSVSNLINEPDLRNIARAIQRIKHKGLSETVKNITESLDLSFWIKLLSKPYHETIWMKLLKYFPTYPGRREDFYKRAREIRNLRNLIAHHAPILHRNLLRDHQYLHELTMILDPQLAQEVQKRSRVLDLLLNTRLVGSGGGI